MFAIQKEIMLRFFFANFVTFQMLGQEKSESPGAETPKSLKVEKKPKRSKWEAWNCMLQELEIVKRQKREIYPHCLDLYVQGIPGSSLEF